MKKIIATLAMLSIATPTIAKPWAYEGEVGRRWWHWDITPHKTGEAYLVVHERYGRWISSGRLRVEFSIRANRSGGRENRTYQPWVVYDELTRCDGPAFCDPPLYPVVSYDKSGKYHNYSSKKWWTHSMTIDCRSNKRAVAEWRDGHHTMRLNMQSICEYFPK